ncbi:MAG: putative metallopeptidase [Bacillota bacterium]
MPEYQSSPVWEDLARALIEARPELRHIAVGSIIFLVDIDASPTAPMARLRKIPAVYQHLLHKDFLLVISFSTTESLSDEQRGFLLYDQLRHIDHEGKLTVHDVQEWAEVAAAAPDWRTTKRQLPDLLAPTFDWERFKGPQMTIGEVIEQAEEEGATVSIEVPSAPQAAASEAPEDPPRSPRTRWSSARGMGTRLAPRAAAGNGGDAA